VSFPTAFEDNHEFVVDLCRFRENLLTEKFIRRKYRLDNATWERLGSDEGNTLVEKIEEESIRRVRDGSAKREKSQQLITKAPGILDSIATDSNASPRHRVDAIKTLDSFCANGPGDTAQARTRFVIRIDLTAGGGDTLTFDKSVTINADDVDPNDTGTAPMIAAITTKKSTDGGNGNAI
jgi:hypothetical protein